MEYDRNIICPHCGSEQIQANIPLVRVVGDGRVFRCDECRKFFRVGMLLEPFVSLLREA